MVFRDALGREWAPRVSCNTLRLLEEQAGVNLFAPAAVTDLGRVASVGVALRFGYLACLAGARGKLRDVTLEDFCDAVQDDTQFAALHEAAMGALVRFIQSRPELATQFQAALQRASQTGTGAPSTSLPPARA